MQKQEAKTEQQVKEKKAAKKPLPTNPVADPKNVIKADDNYADMLQEHGQELSAMKPVAAISTTAEFSKENQPQWDNQLLQEFKDSGLIVERRGIGKVAFNESSVQNITYLLHNETRYNNALVALRSAKEVLKDGIEVGRSRARNVYGVESDMITYAAPVIFNGTRMNVAVSIADMSEYKDGTIYCHNITLENGAEYNLSAAFNRKVKKTQYEKDIEWYKNQKAKNEQRRQQEEETKAEQSNNRMFMLNDNFVTELHEWYKGDRNGNKRFYVGRTSEVLSKITGQEKDIYWYGSKINEIKKKHHNMTLPVIEQVPHILESPVMVLDSRTVDGRIVMFGDVYDKSGNPVLAAVELSASNGSIDDFVLIASAYARGEEIKNPKSRTEALQNFINESNVRYVTEDKKRIQSWLKRTGLQLPFGAKLGFNDVSISDSSENVNRKMSLNDSTGRELSKGQQEYFKDSVIRDEQGRLRGHVPWLQERRWVHGLQGLAVLHRQEAVRRAVQSAWRRFFHVRRVSGRKEAL